jgi:rhamnose utilization protein RhaD (predicted bifunctional aldolase and dehydrogenase)
MDPLLVQGSGGNVSWKEAGKLWIKASGLDLADAARQPIFVPVDLRHLQDVLARGDFTAAPRVLADTSLRPSIETLLHGLMPYPLVVHLHPVEILAHLVRRDADDILRSRLSPALRWASLAYVKPGAALAQALAAALARQPLADVIFMHNHGVVIGAASVADVAEILATLLHALATAPRGSATAIRAEFSQAAARGYRRVDDPGINQLALDPWLFARLTDAWALYPEQVVFLGPAAVACERLADLPAPGAAIAGAPPVFVRGAGVYVPPGFGVARLAMLRCYREVLSRQTDISAIRTLSAAEVAELVDWDAEKYRASMVH